MRKTRKIIAVMTVILLCAGTLLACSTILRDNYQQSDTDTNNNSGTSDDISRSFISNENIETRSAFLSTGVDEIPLGITSPEQDEPLRELDAADADASDTSSSLTLCLLGDIMCLSGQQHAARLDDGSHDYSGCYRFIKPVFDECDYVVGNLETCLAPSSPYAAESKNIAGAPNCNAPSDLLDSLKSVGITNLVTANNHCLDAETNGIAETLAALDAAGIAHTGTHTPETMNDPNSDYMLIRSDDILVAVISVTELINRRYLLSADDMPLYVNEYSPDFIESRIKLAREEGASYVIVYEHWGNENTHEAQWFQKDHAKVIAEAGADLIIGSHSHCVQPLEIIETSDGRQVPCYYSLGNLVSSMAKEINHDTVLVKVNLSWDGTDDNRTMNAQITNIPCHVIWKLDGVSFVIVPTDCDTGHDSDNATLKAAEERISGVLAGTYE